VLVSDAAFRSLAAGEKLREGGVGGLRECKKERQWAEVRGR